MFSRYSLRGLLIIYPILKGSKQTVNLETFVTIPNPTDSTIRTLGLGPCFSELPPDSLLDLHSLAEGELPFESIDPNCSDYAPKIANMLWHRPDVAYESWLYRMEKAFGERWKAQHIYDAIMLSREEIDMEQNLFLATAQF